MHITNFSIVDFYKSNAYQSFPLIICLIAREADLKLDELQTIKTNWNSLNSLTGAKSLFIFSQQQEEDNPPIEKINGQLTRINNPKFCLNNSQIDNFNLLRQEFVKKVNKNKNTPPTKKRWYDNQESQIEELRTFFDLKERDLPCFHLTFLPFGLTLSVKVDPTINIYNNLKRIFEILDNENYSNLVDEISELISKKVLYLNQIQDIKNSQHYQAHISIEKTITQNSFSENISSNLEKLLKNNKKEEEFIENISYLKSQMNGSIKYKQIKKYTGILYDVYFSNKIPKTSIQDSKHKIHELEISIKNLEDNLLNLIKYGGNKIQSSLSTINKSSPISLSKKPKWFDCLELKPNIAGIGINFNYIIELLLRKS